MYDIKLPLSGLKSNQIYPKTIAKCCIDVIISNSLKIKRFIAFNTWIFFKCNQHFIKTTRIKYITFQRALHPGIHSCEPANRQVAILNIADWAKNLKHGVVNNESGFKQFQFKARKPATASCFLPYLYKLLLNLYLGSSFWHDQGQQREK